MATVRSIRVDPKDPVGHRLITIPLITAISQTALVAFAYTPGYAFQVVAVKSFCSALAGTVAGVLQIASRSAVAAVTFTAATEVKETLSSTLANIRGSATDQITFNYTTNGSGALTNGVVLVLIRPYPMHGEAAVGP